jgi:hypothetical protein
VAASIARQGINQQMLDRRLGMMPVSESMSQFAHGGPMENATCWPASTPRSRRRTPART